MRLPFRYVILPQTQRGISQRPRFAPDASAFGGRLRNSAAAQPQTEDMTDDLTDKASLPNL